MNAVILALGVERVAETIKARVEPRQVALPMRALMRVIWEKSVTPANTQVTACCRSSVAHRALVKLSAARIAIAPVSLSALLSKPASLLRE